MVEESLMHYYRGAGHIHDDTELWSVLGKMTFSLPPVNVVISRTSFATGI